MYLVVGLGISGIGIAKYLNNSQIPFCYYDSNPEALEKVSALSFGSFFDVFSGSFTDFTTIIISPGIKIQGENLNPLGQAICNSGVKDIVCDVEMFLRSVDKDAFIIGITGSNGKSTTSSMVYECVKQSGKSVELCGNIGRSVFEALEFAPEVYVVEISSYQLETMSTKRIDLGIITNLSPNHLDRYDGNLEEYYGTKAKIFELSKTSVSTDDMPDEISIGSTYQLSFNNSPKSHFTLKGSSLWQDDEEFAIPPLKVYGNHNLKNAALCMAITKIVGIGKESILTSLQDFKGLPHRCEFVAKKGNVTIINDSKSTTHISTIQSIKTFSGKGRKIILMCGGVAKTVGIEGVADETDILSGVSHIVTYGRSGGDFKEVLAKYNYHNTTYISDFYEAAKKALELSFGMDEECYFILSPLCASFDQFGNFEERGNDFKDFCLRCS